MNPKTKWGPKRALTLFGVLIIGVFGLIAGNNIVENVDSSQIVVIQYPWGHLEDHTTAGWKMQWLGKVTKYDREVFVTFDSDESVGSKANESMKLRFYDGGHCWVSGSVRVRFPVAREQILLLHTRLNGQEALVSGLVLPAINRAVYNTGPLFSSKESYSTKRNQITGAVEDQTIRGIYQTVSEEVVVVDPVSGTEKIATRVNILKGENGKPLRSEESPFEEYGLLLSNFTIRSLEYVDAMEAKIGEQRDATMDAETAAILAKKAKQDAITAEESGKASAAKARWAQETIKATEVTKAEQRRDIAELDKEGAEFYKQQQILEGQGDSEKKRLIFTADGALDKKLAAAVQMNKDQWTAIANYTGNWVPSTVFGSDASAMAGSGAETLIQLLNARTATQISLDMEMKKKQN